MHIFIENPRVFCKNSIFFILGQQTLANFSDPDVLGESKNNSTQNMIKFTFGKLEFCKN